MKGMLPFLSSGMMMFAMVVIIVVIIMIYISIMGGS